MQPALGVCYYPEHWPEATWAEDARRMAAAGITYVRIGEFAWSRIEPRRGDIRLDWLIRAMDVLHAHGLKVVMGTPTATPPRWLVDEMPDMLIVNRAGQTMKFGARRHYCFAHEGYRAECARITRVIAEAIRDHPALALWQTDNEYGCHDSTHSYSPTALAAFRKWLKEKYGTIDTLNAAWGTVFWSMEYNDFEQIELPNLTLTNAAPAHWLDFHRFSSDQVIAFNAVQVEVIRAVTPTIPITHNYMTGHTSFDHFEIGAGMDVASWDSYPIGQVEVREGASPRKARYARQGDPDLQAFHHDLYRSVGAGRFWVMEQQPGPVNWAQYNADPLPGMVRLWGLEGFAHGAETISYFRWRQAPFAQEQMHAGLLRPDGEPAPGLAEASQAIAEAKEHIAETGSGPADCAIVFDYESAWAWDIQPQSQGFSHYDAVLAQYRQLRRLGLNVDLIPKDTDDLGAYKLVFAPALFAWPDKLVGALSRFGGVGVVGPRTGSRDRNFTIPASLPPGLSANLLDVTVARVASLSPNTPVPIRNGGAVQQWLDKVETRAGVLEKTDDGWPVLVQQGGLHYLAGLLDDAAHARITRALVAAAGLDIMELPAGLRTRRNGAKTFVFNYSPDTYDLEKAGFCGPFGLDGQFLAPGGVALTG